MGSRKQWLFNQIVAADPTKNTEDVYNSDVEEVYHQMAIAGSIRGPRYRIGAKLAVMGDSTSQVSELEVGIGASSISSSADSWFSYACFLSGGLLRRGRNAAIAGQTSLQMAARFSQDILAYSPSSVIISCGINDIGQSVSAGGSTPDATVFANYKSSVGAMVSAARASGIEPILTTILPNNAANRKALITQFNLWLKTYAALNGIILLDFYGQAVDTTTGSYSAAMATGDGTHPGSAGQLALGQYVANKLSPLVAVNSPFVAQDNNDPNNLITNGLFGGGAVNGQGIPPGWNIASSFPTGIVGSYVTDGAVSGNMYQVAATASSGPYYVQFGIPGAKWAAGDVLACGGIITSNAGIQPDINFSNQGGVLGRCARPLSAITRGYFYLEQVVPAGSTYMGLNINTATGTGTWSVGQLAVYNLTKLGLV